MYLQCIYSFICYAFNRTFTVYVWWFHSVFTLLSQYDYSTCRLQIQSLSNFRAASLAEVCAVHDKRYPEALHKIVKQQQMEAQYTIVESAPTYVTSSSYQDALQVQPPPTGPHPPTPPPPPPPPPNVPCKLFCAGANPPFLLPFPATI